MADISNHAGGSEMRNMIPRSTTRTFVMAAVIGAFAVAGGVRPAHATFQAEGPLGGNPPAPQKLFLVGATNTTTFTGDVGSQASGVLVHGTTNVAVDVANGFATISPTNKNDLLTTITLTPDDDSLFGDLTFRGTPNAKGTVTVNVVDSDGFAFGPFDFGVGNGNFQRIGAESIDNETIQSLTIFDADGFKDVRQIALSPKCDSPTCGGGGGGGGVPEPASLFLLGSGLVGLGLIRRRRAR